MAYVYQLILIVKPMINSQEHASLVMQDTTSVELFALSPILFAPITTLMVIVYHAVMDIQFCQEYV
jgi:hypothetical protein